MEFEWDERKRLSNLEKHELDFFALGKCLQASYTYASERGENRGVSIGLVAGRLVALVWTKRGDRIRVISLPRARHEERRAYGQLHG